jgi:hypothetical protein
VAAPTLTQYYRERDPLASGAGWLVSTTGR